MFLGCWVFETPCYLKPSVNLMARVVAAVWRQVAIVTSSHLCPRLQSKKSSKKRSCEKTGGWTLRRSASFSKKRFFKGVWRMVRENLQNIPFVNNKHHQTVCLSISPGISQIPSSPELHSHKNLANTQFSIFLSEISWVEVGDLS